MKAIPPVVKTLFTLLVVLSIFALNGWFPLKRSVNADSTLPRPLLAQGEFNSAAPLKNANESLKRIAAKDFNISIDEASRLDFIGVPQRGSTLFIVKASSKNCGSGGCLFLGYFKQENNYKQVFSAYLIDRLPVGTSTFISVKNPDCITVYSLRSYSNPSLISKDFCFKSDRYR